MNAVAQRTDSVDTLAAWLTAYLAAPESLPKASFTVADLLASAGLARNTTNESAMARALQRSGLMLSKRNHGNRVVAWLRPGQVAKLPAPALDLDEMAARAREAVRADIESSARRHSHQLSQAVRDYRQSSRRALKAHHQAVNLAMAYLWLRTTGPDLVRTFRTQGFARGGVWSQASGWLGTDFAPGALTGQPDRRARPRGARP